MRHRRFPGMQARPVPVSCDFPRTVLCAAQNSPLTINLPMQGHARCACKHTVLSVPWEEHAFDEPARAAEFGYEYLHVTLVYTLVMIISTLITSCIPAGTCAS